MAEGWTAGQLSNASWLLEWNWKHSDLGQQRKDRHVGTPFSSTASAWSLGRAQAQEESTAALGVVYSPTQVAKTGQRSPHLCPTNQHAEQVLDRVPCKKTCVG